MTNHQQTLNQERERKQALERAVHEEFGRCLIHLETGVFDERREQLHARFCQMLTVMIDPEGCDSLGIEMRSDGLTLLINPDYFLNTLSTTVERTSALRHAEHHLFLYHPIRAFEHGRVHLSYDARLFAICAELEVCQSLSGHAPLEGSPLPRHYSALGISSRMTAESMCLEFEPLWREVVAATQLNADQPDLSETRNPEGAAALLEISQMSRPCDRRRWLTSRDVDLELTSFQVSRIKTDLDRKLLAARESLSVMDLESVPRADLERAADVSRQYDLSSASCTPEESAQVITEAREEIEAIIVQMQISDPFFGRYLSSCVRQITTAISTAGVGVYRDYIALLINPQFFMHQLKDRAERGAVLKHEALHIMLKHVILIRDPKFTSRQLYNIAADIEVNQYIGRPWSLPQSAVTLSTFPHLDLPPNDVAETYYNMLLKAAMSDDPSITLVHQSGSNPSDHRGWGQSDQGQGNISSPLPVSESTMQTHDLSIERQVQKAVDATPNRYAGSIPGRILKLLEEWAQARAPLIDWKRELRLFVSTSPSYRRKHSNRKVNKRYARLIRRALDVHQLTADALILIARRSPDLMPELTWGDLCEVLRDEALSLRPKLISCDLDAPLPWVELPRLIVHQLHRDRSELQWPTWSALTDLELIQLGMLRTPLKRDTLPSDLIVVVSREYPELLPQISWEILGDQRTRELKHRYPHLKRIRTLTWRTLPTDEVARLTREIPELFPITWADVPPQLIARMPYYQISGDEVFRVSRIMKRQLPGLTRERKTPELLAVVDTSGSVSDDDIASLFDEIDGMAKLSPKVYVLQVDADVELFYEYRGQRPVAGRGGTIFEAAFRWLDQAREGVMTPVLVDGKVIQKRVRLKVDGLIYLTDGYAACPTTRPYCRTMWVLTSSGSTDENIKDWEHTSKVITLPPRPD